MTKATLTLKSGATVTIEGSPVEVHELLRLHDSGGVAPRSEVKLPTEKTTARGVSNHDDPISEVVNAIRSCDQAEAIEKNVLDKSDVGARCLLPLFIIHEELHNAFALTTGQISSVTRELGIPVLQSNVAHAFSGGTGRFVMASRTRKRGIAVEYRINRRGVEHMKKIIEGTSRTNA